MYYHQKNDKVDRWLVSVSYKDENGLSKRKWKTAHSLKEAKAMEDELKKEVRLKRDLTIDDIRDELFKKKESENKKSSLGGYKVIYECYIHDKLGKLYLDDINAGILMKWKDGIPSELSLARKRTIYIVLHMLLKYAFNIHGSNAIYSLDAVGNFKADPNAVIVEKKLKYWKPEQFFLFSQKLSEYCLQANPRTAEYMARWSSYVLLSICFYAGLRRGEANALFANDFHDGENPYLNITKSVTKKVKGGGWYLTGPKNKQSVRKVPIPKALATILREHIENRLKRLKCFENTFYLCGGIKPVNDSTTDRIKEQIERENNIPHISVHDLRHSYVSVLINSNVPITTISKLVGHSSPDITWKVYSHLYPETINSAINIFDEMKKEK